MAVSTLGPGQVIDLRGGSQLDGLGESLGMLIKGLSGEKDKQMLKAILGDPTLSQNIATSGYEIVAKAREIDPNVSTFEEATKVLDAKGLGDAKVRPDQVGVEFPGKGMLKPQVFDQMMALYPGLRREVDTRRAKEGQVSAEEEAQVATLPTRETLAGEEAVPVAERARILALEAEGRATELDYAILNNINQRENLAALRAQVSPEELATLERYKVTQSIADLKLQGEATERLVAKFNSASDFEKEVISAGMAGPAAQGWLQYLLGERQFAQQMDIATYQHNLAVKRQNALAQLQADLAGAKDPFEILQTQTKFKLEVRDAARETIDRINEAAADKSRRDELPALIRELNDDAETLMLIDPASWVATANEVSGIIRTNKIVGVEFGLTEALERAGPQAKMIGMAQMIVERGMTDEVMAEVRASPFITDPRTGRFHDRAYAAVQELAVALKANPQMFEKASADVSAEAAVERQSIRNLQDLRPLWQRRNREIQALEAELTTARSEGEGPGPRSMTPNARASELALRLFRLKLLNFINKPPGITAEPAAPVTPAGVDVR